MSHPIHTLMRLAVGAALLPLCTLAAAQAVPNGKQAYQECLACHATGKGVNGVGPSLAGIVGSKAADVPGFQFSGPMKRSGIVWTIENLDKYIADPQAVVPGTRMPYSGMPEARQRAELIQYLVTLN